MSHPAFTLLAALLLSASFALAERAPGARWRVGARLFAGCAAALVCGSWLMRLIHG